MVEIEVYPPASFRFTSRKVGNFTMSVEIGKGETLSDLLNRLSLENPEAWRKLYNEKSRRMKGPVRAVLNGKALPATALPETVISDTDHIAFKILYGGG